MNYQKIYTKLIERARTRELTGYKNKRFVHQGTTKITKFLQK